MPRLGALAGSAAHGSGRLARQSAGAQLLEPLGEEHLELLHATPFQQHVPVGTGRLTLLWLGPGAVDPQRLGAADAALPDLGHLGFERERDREAVSLGAVVGHALTGRHLDARVRLVALGTES